MSLDVEVCVVHNVEKRLRIMMEANEYYMISYHFGEYAATETLW